MSDSRKSKSYLIIKNTDFIKDKFFTAEFLKIFSSRFLMLPVASEAGHFPYKGD